MEEKKNWNFHFSSDLYIHWIGLEPTNDSICCLKIGTRYEKKSHRGCRVSHTIIIIIESFIMMLYVRFLSKNQIIVFLCVCVGDLFHNVSIFRLIDWLIRVDCRTQNQIHIVTTTTTTNYALFLSPGWIISIIDRSIELMHLDLCKKKISKKRTTSVVTIQYNTHYR